MKHKNFLKKYDLVAMYQDYLTHLDVTHASKVVGVVYSTASKAIKTLQGLMAGEKINRKKMATEFILAAEASAKEQELQRLTISDQLLRKLWIEKWNGTVPGIVSGSDANLFLQIPK